MGFLGMAASGCGFIFLGLWHAFSPFSSSQPLRSFGNPSTSFLSAQSVAIAAISFLHIISGLVASHGDAALADGIGSAVPLERSGVALIFFIFAITRLISLHTRILPLPREILNLIALFAFGQEFLLFYFQRPDAGLESRYYSLILVPVCACLMAVAAGIAFPHSTWPSLALAGGLVLQGTWLIQMAFSFFRPGFITSGCSLRMRGDGDYVIDCNNEESMTLMRAKAVATLQFNCHMALLIIIMLPLYAFTRRWSPVPNVQDLNYEMVASVDSYAMRRDSRTLPASVFSLEFEEELDDKPVTEDHSYVVDNLHRAAA